MKKRILSAAITICMMLLLLPAVVSAEGEQTYTAAEFLATAADTTEGKKITLINDVTITDALTTTVDYIIDLGGHTLKLDAANNLLKSKITIKNGTIDISGVVASGDCIIGVGHYNVAGSLKMEGVTLAGSNYSSAYAVIYVYGSNTLTMDGCTVTLTKDASAAGGAIKAEKSTGVINIINETTMNLTDTVRGIVSGIVLIENSTVTMKGTTGTSAGLDNGINGSALTVKNSDVTITGYTGRALTVSDAGVTVEASNLSFAGAENCEADIRFKTDDTLTIDGESTLSASGEIIADESVGQEALELVELPSINAVERVDGVLTIVKLEAVATITNAAGQTTEYSSLKDAIADAQSGAAIELLKDETLTGTGVAYIIDKSLTINANRHTVSTETHSKVFEVQNAAETAIDVVFNDITITNAAANGRCIDTRNDYINLTINVDSTLNAANVNAQPLTIGGYDTAGTVNVVVDSNINCGDSGYGIISFVKSDIEINGTITGWNGVYMKAGSEGSIVDVNGTLDTTNVHSEGSNGFGAIVLETDNIIVNINDGAVINAATNSASNQTALILSSDAAGNTADNYIKVTIAENATVNADDILLGFDAASNNVDVTITVKNTALIAALNKEGAVEGFYVPESGIVTAVQAVENAVATVNGVQYADLQSAIDAAEAGDIVILADDIILTDSGVAYTINKVITIEGNGKTITTATQSKVFEIKNEAEVAATYALARTSGSAMTVTFTNIAIINTAANGRCVDTRTDNIELILNADAVLIANGGGNPQPLTIGGYETEGVIVHVNGSINAGNSGYGIIAFVPASITVNGTITGYGTVYMKQGSAGSDVTVNGLLKANNVSDGAENNFAAIVFGDNDIEVTINGLIEISETGSAEQSAISFVSAPEGNRITVTISENAVIVGDILRGFDVNKATVTVAAANADVITALTAEGQAEGFDLPKNADGSYGVQLHVLTAHAKKEATCTEEGHEEYWHCEACDTYYSDAAGQNVTTLDALTIPAAGHKLTAFTKIEPTCTETGTEAYWYCEICQKYYSDAEAKNEIAAPVVIPALGHVGVKHDHVPASCTESGWEGEIRCERCDVLLEANEENQPFGHAYVDGVCVVCGEVAATSVDTPSPATGDTSNTGLWVFLAVLAGVSLAGSVMLGKKTSHHK